VRQKLGSRDSRGRPLSVYGILAIGVATLLVLLLVVYFSASDRDNPDQPICTSIQPAQAENAVRDGQAQRLTIAYDDEIEMPTNKRWGPVLARLDYADGQCANLPQGIANQGDVYAIVGVINFYNETTENPQVEIVYDRSNSLDEGLFVPPTIPTTPTPVPTATPVEGLGIVNESLKKGLGNRSLRGKLREALGVGRIVRSPHTIPLPSPRQPAGPPWWTVVVAADPDRANTVHGRARALSGCGGA